MYCCLQVLLASMMPTVSGDFLRRAALLASISLAAATGPAGAGPDEEAKANAFVQQMRSGTLVCPLDLLDTIPEVWSIKSRVSCITDLPRPMARCPPT